MGYFADRYGFEQVGAVVPSISTQAEASAGELAELTARIEEAGITVLFTEVGTPSAVVDAIADETGATIVELPSHTLPDDGSYFTFVQEIAAVVASGLSL
jgi:zinc/manganese transport system substrate-binding protein